MKKVLIRGPFLTASGYGVHSRQIARWAISKKDWDVKVQATPWGVTSWILDKDAQNGLIEEIMVRTVTLQQGQVPQYDLSVQVQLPNEWDPSLAKVNIGVTAAVETDRCNPSWVAACNQMDVIVVPSTFTKRTLENTGHITTPVIVIPESFYDEVLDEEIPPLDHEFSTKFNFLVFGQLTGNNPENDRKNLAYTLKWICEEFKDDPNVGIILKTNSGRNTKIDRLVTEKFAKDLINRIRPGEFPKIHLLHGKMTNKEMVSLYRNETVKCLVSFTRGEGYGLPILEAAATGLPTIVTNWSGHLDFLRNGKFISVDYNLEPIHPSRVDGQIFLNGARWAAVKEKDAKRKLRKFYEKSSMPTQWAKDLSQVLQKKYNHNALVDVYDLHLKEWL